MNSMKTHPGIVSVEIHGSFLLVADKEARKTCPYCCRISDSGAFIWNLLTEGRNIEEIPTLVKEEFDIPESMDLNDDISIFIDLLKKHHYIIEENIER